MLILAQKWRGTAAYVVVWYDRSIMTNVTTDRAQFVFKVTEYGDEEHTPWIMTEPRTANLKILGKGGFIGFDLRPGTTFEQARQVAEYLDRHIECITCTLFQE